jgi:aminopeptidase N
MATIKLAQTQNTEDGTPIYRFPLDVHITTGEGKKELKFNVDSKEHTFQIPFDSEPSWFSVDPANKLLKRMDVKAPKQMLIEQLKNGSTVERLYATKALSNFSSDDVVDALKNILMNDSFWGVSAECARALSNMKTDNAYKVLADALNIAHPKARRAVVKAIGEFKKKESVSVLQPLFLEDESYFVQAEAAVSLGKSTAREAFVLLLKALRMRSFNEVIAANALAGFGELKDDTGTHLLIEHSKIGEHHKVREAATLALGKFAKNNDKVVEHLKQLLKDKWFRVRINAIKAFVEAQEPKSIPEIEWVANNDIDPRVRRVAEEGIIAIRESMQMPKEVAEMREEVEKLKMMNLELVQKIDRLERELK